MTDEALAKLKSFSALANRGDLHPLDMERWRAFIIQEHADGASLNDSAIKQWLVDDGWREERAVDLAGDYYEGRLLLKDYGA